MKAESSVQLKVELRVSWWVVSLVASTDSSTVENLVASTVVPKAVNLVYQLVAK